MKIILTAGEDFAHDQKEALQKILTDRGYTAHYQSVDVAEGIFDIATHMTVDDVAELQDMFEELEDLKTV